MIPTYETLNLALFVGWCVAALTGLVAYDVFPPAGTP